MGRWSAEDIPWREFSPVLLDPELLKLVKAAALVERNAADYAAYLHNVFPDDAGFRASASAWRDEEIQHGEVLGRYAALADPGFDFAARLRRFADGFRIDVDATRSVRGTLSGELLARCIVETGTSSFYSAIRDATDEPVLKAIAHRIAGDEFRHYKLFYEAMGRYRAAERPSLIRRIAVAVARIRETDDDELAYAWHAANDPLGEPYDRRRCNQAYAARAYALYRPRHTERLVGMVLKAIGLEPQGWLADKAKAFAWAKIRRRARAAG